MLAHSMCTCSHTRRSISLLVRSLLSHSMAESNPLHRHTTCKKCGFKFDVVAASCYSVDAELLGPPSAYNRPVQPLDGRIVDYLSKEHGQYVSPVYTQTGFYGTCLGPVWFLPFCTSGCVLCRHCPPEHRGQGLRCGTRHACADHPEQQVHAQSLPISARHAGSIVLAAYCEVPGVGWTLLGPSLPRSWEDQEAPLPSLRYMCIVSTVPYIFIPAESGNIFHPRKTVCGANI